MGLIKQMADNTRVDSKASQFRRKRAAFFQSLLATLPRPLTLLDVGGTESYWDLNELGETSGIEITLLNLEPLAIGRRGFKNIVGDARNMKDFGAQTFDVVFSNSVIEHVGSFRNQRQMADEVRRVGKRYFIQTPNWSFPIEPHFLVPGFQFLPARIRAALHVRYNLGWMKKAATYEEALEDVRAIRLLSTSEMHSLFPEARLYQERFIGLTKSIVAYAGWDQPGDHS